MTDASPGTGVHPVAVASSSTWLRPADLLLVSVTEHGWRVVDGRRGVGSRRRVLAFVELQRDGFEVMQLGRGFECHWCATLAEVVDLVCATAERIDRHRT